jgi:hypothetical protein
MATLTLTGPAIPVGTHNVVLRDAQIHSPVSRSPSQSTYHVIDVGIREGSYTTWIGAWDQSAQKLDAATPTSILNADRLGMRLKSGQEVVVRVTSVGSPTSLVGVRINFRLALVGGRDGRAKPLVAAGASVADANSRVALAALEKQINVGGLSEWDDPVALQDPAGVVSVGYVAGMGGAVTQGTSKSTGVTLSKLTGQITTHNAALNAGIEVAFTVTNTLVAATDVVVVCIASGGTSGSYLVSVSAVAAGSFDITISNASAGNLSEALVLNFVVLKGVAS